MTGDWVRPLISSIWMFSFGVLMYGFYKGVLVGENVNGLGS